MIMKKQYVRLLCATLAFALCLPVTSALAADTESNLQENEYCYLNAPKEEDKDFVDFVLALEQEPHQQALTANATVRVVFTVAADEEYRTNKGAIWKNKAGEMINTAIQFQDLIGVRYEIGSYREWYSDDYGLPSKLLSDVYRDCRPGTYENILIGITGQQMSWPATGDAPNISGIAKQGNPYLLVEGDNWLVLRHELGHCYTLQHCSNACIMNSYPFPYYKYNDICYPHRDEWTSQNGRYYMN